MVVQTLPLLVEYSIKTLSTFAEVQVITWVVFACQNTLVFGEVTVIAGTKLDRILYPS